MALMLVVTVGFVCIGLFSHHLRRGQQTAIAMLAIALTTLYLVKPDLM